MNIDESIILCNMDNNVVYAEGVKDSTGTVQGVPEFEDENDSFVAKSLRYNFKTEQGKEHNLS